MNTLRSVFVGVLFGIFTFALFTPGPLSKHRLTAPSMDVIAQVRSSAVSVVNPSGGQGSGVIFHRQGRTYVLTAAHVVDGLSYHAEVQVRQGLYDWPAILVNADPEHDVALLRLENRSLVGYSADLSTKVLPVGTALLHVGNLLGEYPGSYLEGILAAVSQNLENVAGDYDQTSIIAWPGSSGGGVFTTDGKLVGIITRGVGPGLNFMVPARVLRQWAKDNDLQWLFQK